MGLCCCSTLTMAMYCFSSCFCTAPVLQVLTYLKDGAYLDSDQTQSLSVEMVTYK